MTEIHPSPLPAGRVYQGQSAQSRKAERRQKLMTAAVTVFGQQGYHASTVSAICEAAGLTKRYFYEEFPDKEVLLCAVYVQSMAEIRKTVMRAWNTAHPLPQRILAGASAYFDFIEAHPDQARIFLLEMEGISEQVNLTLSKEASAITDMLRQSLFSGPLSAHANPDLLALGVLGAIYQMAKAWFIYPGGAQDTRVSQDEMAVQVQLMCLGMIRAAAPADAEERSVTEAELS